MSLILVPSEDFTLFSGDTPVPDNQILDPNDEHVIAELIQSDVVDFTCNLNEMTETDIGIYAFTEVTGEIFNIAEEKQMWFNAMSSLLPSQLDTFEILFKDLNGKTAHIAIKDEDLYKKDPLLMDALNEEEGFNATAVATMGVHIVFKDYSEYEAKYGSSIKYKLIVRKLIFSSAPIPHYCQPQEVMDFLGVRNNDGSVFEISNSSSPSYDTVAQIICQAENAIEQATRTSWTLRRAKNEIRNIASMSIQGTGVSPYLGVFQPTGAISTANSFFRGRWCQLIHTNVKDIDADKGDKLEIRMFGDNWRDITGTGAYWMDNAKGALYIRQWFVQKDASVRITYRYGNEEVPEDMRRAAILFTAKHILTTSQLYRFLFPENPESENRWAQTAINFQYEYDKLIKGRIEGVVIGGV